MQDFEYRRTRRRRAEPPPERKPVKVYFNLCQDCARKMDRKNGGAYSLSLINQTANAGRCQMCFKFGSLDRYRKN